MLIPQQLGFVVPFGTKPEQCYDEITPNDMFSNLTCAFSGAFLVSGGLSMAVWSESTLGGGYRSAHTDYLPVFIRALSMHLQICWDYMPGKTFFYAAQGLGWSVAAAFFTATITVTGVSFRFGEVCHVNSANSMKDFWGPLLAIAGAAMVVQLATFVYCIKVYLQNMWSDDKTETQSSAGLPSYTTSVRTRSARVVYRRVRKVVWLQWRGITIVVFILVDVIFFSVVFIYLNSVSGNAVNNIEKAMPFLLCLITNPTKLDKCYSFGQDLFVNQSTVVAILIMLSVSHALPFSLRFVLTLPTAGRYSMLHPPRPHFDVHSMAGALPLQSWLKARIRVARREAVRQRDPTLRVAEVRGKPLEVPYERSDQPRRRIRPFSAIIHRNTGLLHKGDTTRIHDSLT